VSRVFTCQKVQFRLKGQLYVITSPDIDAFTALSGFPGDHLQVASSDLLTVRDFWESERVRVWKAISPKMQRSFSYGSPGEPSSKFADPSNSEADSDVVSRNFALLVLDVSNVDKLDLNTEPLRRTFWSLDDAQTAKWSDPQPVNP
jgi:hypothetical protein